TRVAEPAPRAEPAKPAATPPPARRVEAPQPQPAPAPVSSPAPTASSSTNGRVEPTNANRVPAGPEMRSVPSGTTLTVVMADEVSTSTSNEGDSFHAELSEPIVVDGRIVAERGDPVTGRVEEVVKPGRVKGRAQLKLVLTEITTNDRKYKIKTEPFVAIAVDNKERDAAIIAGGAGVGAAIGAITGGKKGAAIGAVLGGGGGTATVLATPGQSMKIEPETKVNFVLDNDVRLPVVRSKAD
ncbi:MAG TPA: hypothetical protein VFR05_10410, partial [Terriglobia bacterium]|nr:hypothetical protein [Terriglobia bacterium]